MNVAIDLDGTVLFAESSAIAIPGRSRASYLSNYTASLLVQLSQLCNLYIATARNASSIRVLLTRIPDARFAGFVMECGHVCRADLESIFPVSNERNALVQLLKWKFADWEVVDGYEQIICIVASASCDDATSDVKQLLLEHPQFSGWKVQAEGHKTFLYPSNSCKMSGLRSIGVDILDVAAGDAQIFDFSMLSAAILPCTLESADESIISLVRHQNGLVIAGNTHGGAEVLLRKIIDHVNT